MNFIVFRNPLNQKQTEELEQIQNLKEKHLKLFRTNAQGLNLNDASCIYEEMTKRNQSNPHVAFLGDGRAEISLPYELGNIGQTTGGLGMSLPKVNSLNKSSNFQQIQSQLNTNEININLQQQEMHRIQEVSSHNKSGKKNASRIPKLSSSHSAPSAIN
ncbi:hypothetical protein F8M41_017611 [Gigaspora margarita]|uniref:Uncharacterized protein n=1 Tax=Gigaspora margarita TaxID=4874 RepID=A0A8H4ELX6_GIGMA|nr:hypothetical protein F8M41_017611 [Gigaspora margarita]